VSDVTASLSALLGDQPAVPAEGVGSSRKICRAFAEDVRCVHRRLGWVHGRSEGRSRKICSALAEDLQGALERPGTRSQKTCGMCAEELRG
jgi:hypothetical protein